MHLYIEHNCHLNVGLTWTIPDSPAEPQNVKVTEYRGEAVKLEWETAEEDNGATPTKYTILKNKTDSDNQNHSEESLDMSVITVVLDKGPEYQLQVPPEKDIGWGDFRSSIICTIKGTCL